MYTRSRIFQGLPICMVVLALLFMSQAPVSAQPGVIGPSVLPFPTGYSHATFGSFNEVGQAVGFVHNYEDDYDYITVWNGSNPSILGEGWAISINNSGQVAGMHDRQVALWQPGSTEPEIIPTPEAPGFSGAVAINESGVMAGCYGNVWFFGSNPNYAFIYDSNTDTFTDLSVPLGKSCAFDINDLGQVVGESVNGIFLFTPNANPEIQFLTGGPDTGSAYAINNMGWVTGTAYDSTGNQHAFLWKPGDPALTFLGEDTLIGKGINDFWRHDRRAQFLVGRRCAPGAARTPELHAYRSLADHQPGCRTRECCLHRWDRICNRPGGLPAGILDHHSAACYPTATDYLYQEPGYFARVEWKTERK
jgi:probable HAF family extracellular repeat protein